ncbi:Uncharacterised protein [Legionella hackeliae]|nr:hypothetical protein [Legionella hackeliae]STX46925.1 Uncharacterised protein [Legionella hackeliae]
MTTIWDYVDKVKKKESLPPHIPSKLLSESAFAEKVSPGFSPIQSKDPGLNNKMRSKGVKYLAADYAGMAVLELEKNPEVYTDQMLIDICYKERYPLIHQMLTKALYIEQTYPWKEKIDKSHPLFELAFAHGPVLEFCLSKPGFGKIFNDEAILLLMQKGFLDPAIFFTKLTRVSSSIELDLQIVNFVVGNLPACSFLAKALINEDKVDKQLLLTVLFSTKTKAFFQDTLLTDLFMTGHISLSMIDKILPYKIDKQLFKQLNHNTRMEYLKMLFFASETMKEEKFLEVKTTTPSTLITASKLEDVEEENAEHTDFDQDLFTVPEVKTVKPTESAKKPGINVGLLIQSMTNGGILQSPTLSHVEHPEKSKSVEIKVNVL